MPSSLFDEATEPDPSEEVRDCDEVVRTISRIRRFNHEAASARRAARRATAAKYWSDADSPHPRHSRLLT
jgi:hypothetical protein